MAELPGPEGREGPGLRDAVEGGRGSDPNVLTSIEYPHYQNFIDAMRAGDEKKLNCNIQEGHLSSVLPHLANIAYRLKRMMPLRRQDGDGAGRRGGEPAAHPRVPRSVSGARAGLMYGPASRAVLAVAALVTLGADANAGVGSRSPGGGSSGGRFRGRTAVHLLRLARIADPARPLPDPLRQGDAHHAGLPARSASGGADRPSAPRRSLVQLRRRERRRLLEQLDHPAPRAPEADGPRAAGARRGRGERPGRRPPVRRSSSG